MIALVEQIDEHRAAFAYDWRSRFGLSIDVVGDTMSWDEAVMLTRELLKDPSSHVTAAVNGWSYPWSAETFILADLFDAYVMVHTDRKHRGSPRARPFDEQQRTRAALPQKQIIEELRKRGHLRVVKGAQ